MVETLTPEKIHEQRSIRTVAGKKGEWLANVRANAKNKQEDLSSLWLDNNYKEMISVAAGPSLKNDLDKLKKMVKHGNREVVCVDAAYRFLIENEIVPDYMICTDSSDNILGMIEGIDNTKTKLILNVIASPKVVEAWKGKVYWFVMANQFYDLDNKAMIQDLHALVSKIGTKIVPGANVSSISLGFSLSIRNASKLFLFGHDFCWKDDMYCGDYMKTLEKERLTMEGKSKTIFKTTNTKGETVLTNLSLQQFSIWHENALKSMKDRVENMTSSTIMKI